MKNKVKKNKKIPLWIPLSKVPNVSDKVLREENTRVTRAETQR